MATYLYQARKDYLSFMEAQGMSPRTVQGHSQTLDHALNANSAANNHWRD